MPAPVPDHRAVCAHFSSQTKTRGRGYWKQNTTMCQNEQYKNDIRRLIEQTLNEYEHVVCKRDVWDLCKIRVKEYSIKFSIAKSKERKEEIEKIENEIINLDSALANSQDNDLVNHRKTLKSELDIKLKERAIGAQVRSRAKWVEEGEQVLHTV